MFIAAAPTTDFLGSFFWQFTTFIVAIVAVIGFLVYRYYLEPPISRQFMAAKWKAGTPAFIQDNANVVHFTTSDKDLPEGVIHNRRGWFLLSRAPHIPEAIEEKRGPGRPPKAEGEKEDDSKLTPQQSEALETVLQVPTLAGFNKAVFFGYDGAPLLSNLKTLSIASVKENNAPQEKGRFLVGHADLRVLKEIIPATISRTQLGNLHRWATAKGYEKRGGEATKLIIIALACATVLGVMGIVAYMVLNGGKPPTPTA